jgi:flagellar basal-body rod protein FlgB
MGDLLDKTTRALAASADLRSLRQNVVTANIANAETPNYTAKKLDFEEALGRALELEGVGDMKTGDQRHYMGGAGSMHNVKADTYENPDVSVNNDGNTVDLEREMSTLAENSLLYKAAIQLINKKLAQLKYACGEGGR